MLSWVTAKNVGDVFLRHTVVELSIDFEYHLKKTRFDRLDRGLGPRPMVHDPQQKFNRNECLSLRIF